MGTPKSLRAAPPRRFENYVLTRSTSPQDGLTQIIDIHFTPCYPASSEFSSGSVVLEASGAPGTSGATVGWSVNTPIGFDFQIDGVTYKQFVTSVKGWLALVDPSTGTFSIFDITTQNDNAFIKSSFSTKVALLAPWFDNLYNTWAETNPVNSTQSISDRVKYGLQPPLASRNQAQFAVKFYRDDHSPEGRRLIVRWNSFVPPGTTSVIRFEAVLYENGKIEYRYAPKSLISIPGAGSDVSEGATIGIFMPGATNRWRDFSFGLGYRDTERQQYRFGGAVPTATYADTDLSWVGSPSLTPTSSYTINLKSSNNWPGQTEVGTTLTFAPPQNRRKVLPKLETYARDNKTTRAAVLRTGDSRQGLSTNYFDDRRALFFTNVVSGSGGVLVDYPTTLQRFFGDSEPGVTGRQNLFSDFQLTGSIVKNSVDQFVGSELSHYIEPFSEHRLPENDPAATLDPFFTSGSSLSHLGDNLQQPLKSKTKLKFSLPVQTSISMLPGSSSIYYYNASSRSWNVPLNSSYLHQNGSGVNDDGLPRGDIANTVSDAQNKRVIEDQRGFGPIGNSISSGSHRATVAGEQSDTSIGQLYTTQRSSNAVSKFYAKSVPVNNDYAATRGETFQLPITQPFLIERAVFNIPFAAGDGWFQDKTTCFSPLEVTPGSFDFAGPALTVALFNQITIGSSTRRDLIMTGTITHKNDNMAEIVFANSPGIDSTFQIRPRGFQAFGVQPSAVVTPSTTGAGSVFTGSVMVKCEAAISNGIIARLELAMTGGTAAINRSGVVDIFNTPEIVLKSGTATNYAQSSYVAYINNFGRAATGFDPSGRSAFGKEHAASQQISRTGRVTNPFYLTQSLGKITLANITTSGIPAQFAAAILAGSNFKFEAAIPLEGHSPSPYVVMPGDNLVLAISKTRPFVYSTQAANPFTTGSIQHDTQLITGSIGVTLYGSLLKESKEFHDGLNQLLVTDAVHETVIGNDPVIDQFESAYREEYIGGFSDDVITGSLVTRINNQAGQSAFVTGNYVALANNTFLSVGSRGRAYSNANARNESVDSIGGFISASNPSKASRLQPIFEKIGTPRVSVATSNAERFWDSMMPSIDQCFAANGKGIYLTSHDPANLPTSPGRMLDKQVGIIFFNDYISPTNLNNTNHKNDVDWPCSYPFEPRYAGIPRQQFIEKSFNASTVDVDDGSSSTPVIHPLPTTLVKGIAFGSTEPNLAGFAGGPYTYAAATVPPTTADVGTFLAGGLQIQPNRSHQLLVDAKLNQISTTLTPFVVTSSASVDDISRTLYGFGDLNTVRFLTDSPDIAVRFGTNHFADFRESHYADYYDNTDFAGGGGQNESWRYCYSPIIRGWKYGVYSGLAAFSKAYFRKGRYGQFRDMLEQRPFTKFYQTAVNNPDISNFQEGVTDAPVTVRFVDSLGHITQPENTWSSNLSFEVTSSIPYCDGDARNRPPIDLQTLNTKLLSITNDNGNLSL